MLSKSAKVDSAGQPSRRRLFAGEGTIAIKAELLLMGIAGLVGAGAFQAPASAQLTCILDSDFNGVSSAGDTDGGASATDIFTTACGESSTAAGQSGTAVGALASADGRFSVAIGTSADVLGDDSTAIGVGSGTTLTGTQSVVIGRNIESDEANQLIISTNLTGFPDNISASNVNGVSAISLGNNADTNGDNAIAMGTNLVASGNSAIAIGSGSDAVGDSALAVGANANAIGADSIAIGEDTNAGASSVVLGANANAAGVGSVALGSGSVATGDNVVSVGSVGNERRITNVATGTADTDAVNVSQLNAVTGDVSAMQATVATHTTQITALQAADLAFDTRIDTLELVAEGLDDRIGKVDDRASAGTAAAVALSGAMFLPGKSFNLTGNVGSYRGAHAAALQFGALVSENVAINAGIGHGFNKGGKTALRAGFTIGW